jgi:hypothetical protein
MNLHHQKTEVPNSTIEQQHSNQWNQLPTHNSQTQRLHYETSIAELKLLLLYMIEIEYIFQDEDFIAVGLFIC